MRLFRVGYVVTLSFLIVLSVIMLTFGFYPTPKGPKAPEYPSYSDLSVTYDSEAYRQRQQQYDQKQKVYQAEQKNFLQDKIVPYARNVFVFWIVMLLITAALGAAIARFVSELVGAGFAFSGVWAVLFGPLASLIWFANSLVRSFGRRAEQEFTVEPLLQAVGLTTLFSVVILAVVGVLLFRNRGVVSRTKPDTSPAQ